MMYSQTVQTVKVRASEEAKRCGNVRIEPAHLLIAVCQLVYDTAFGTTSPKEKAWLDGFFQAGEVRPADLANLLRQELRSPGTHASTASLNPSNQYDRIFCAAEEYAKEENRTSPCVSLRHLLVPLIMKLGGNPVFETLLKSAGGGLGGIREYLGLYPSTAVGPKPGPQTLRADQPKQSEQAGRGLQSAAANPAAAPVPNKAILAKFQAADEAMRQAKDLEHTFYLRGGAGSRPANEAAKRERWELVVKLYQEALRDYPNSSPGWNNLGVAYMRLGRFQESEGAFKKASREDPYNADAYANLGILLARHLQRFEEGIHYLERALQLNPRHDCRRYLDEVKSHRTGKPHQIPQRRPDVPQQVPPRKKPRPMFVRDTPVQPSTKQNAPARPKTEHRSGKRVVSELARYFREMSRDATTHDKAMLAVSIMIVAGCGASVYRELLTLRQWSVGAVLSAGLLLAVCVWLLGFAAGVHLRMPAYRAMFPPTQLLGAATVPAVLIGIGVASWLGSTLLGVALLRSIKVSFGGQVLSAVVMYLLFALHTPLTQKAVALTGNKNIMTVDSHRCIWLFPALGVLTVFLVGRSHTAPDARLLWSIQMTAAVTTSIFTAGFGSGYIP